MRHLIIAIAALASIPAYALDLEQYGGDGMNYMQVHSSVTYDTFCEGFITRCDDATGIVTVINHSTGERNENVLINPREEQRTFLVKETCTLDDCTAECPSGSSITSVMCLAFNQLDLITIERVPAYQSINNNSGSCFTDIAFDPSDTSVAVTINTSAVCLRH